MGYYINDGLGARNKAVDIIRLYEAVEIDQPLSMMDVPSTEALICVVENGLFDAAGLIYNEREFQEFAVEDTTGRPRTWLLMEREKAHQLAGYRE